MKREELSLAAREVLASLPKGTILREDPDGSLWVRVKRGDVRFGERKHPLECREFEA